VLVDINVYLILQMEMDNGNFMIGIEGILCLSISKAMFQWNLHIISVLQDRTAGTTCNFLMH
jgi:hypothetical protein